MRPTADDHRFLLGLQRDTFGFFTSEVNPQNGLVRDRTAVGSPASIAAVGMALACYPVAVDRGYLTRSRARELVLTTLRFLWQAPQDSTSRASGHRGFFYHFLDMDSGRRSDGCELSTIDSAILFAGALTAGRYFDGPGSAEGEIRELADALFRRAEWDWFANHDERVPLSWTPERGFQRYHWGGYNEALILFALGMGSPTHPLPTGAYERWLETYSWKRIYGHDFAYCGPLFTHQLSHLWIDFRGIQDAFMRSRGIDYFENSRRATLVQREYARRNPRKHRGYDDHAWGITASDGPGPASHEVDGRSRNFWGYRARGVPWGPDDGTLSPWGVAASLPFAPDLVLSTLKTMTDRYPALTSRFGFKCSVNPTFPTDGGGPWVAERYFGLDQGPVVLMIENFESELVWRLMKNCPYLRLGLKRSGFTGGWLE